MYYFVTGRILAWPWVAITIKALNPRLIMHFMVIPKHTYLHGLTIIPKYQNACDYMHIYTKLHLSWIYLWYPLILTVQNSVSLLTPHLLFALDSRLNWCQASGQYKMICGLLRVPTSPPHYFSFSYEIFKSNMSVRMTITQ